MIRNSGPLVRAVRFLCIAQSPPGASCHLTGKAVLGFGYGTSGGASADMAGWLRHHHATAAADARTPHGLRSRHPSGKGDQQATSLHSVCLG